MIDYSLIPESTLETLQAWIKSARPMGHFCTAVVTNNLSEAVSRGDPENRAALVPIVFWMCQNAPISSWGSPEALQVWPAIVKEIRATKRAKR